MYLHSFKHCKHLFFNISLSNTHGTSIIRQMGYNMTPTDRPCSLSREHADMHAYIVRTPTRSICNFLHLTLQPRTYSWKLYISHWHTLGVMKNDVAHPKSLAKCFFTSTFRRYPQSEKCHCYIHNRSHVKRMYAIRISMGILYRMIGHFEFQNGRHFISSSSSSKYLLYVTFRQWHCNTIKTL